MIDQIKSARSIFLEIVENVPREKWAESLDQACGEDEQLRTEVQRLLHAHDEIGTFMDRPAADPFTIDSPIAETPGTVIGPYKLLQQIGEGGMGVVFMAEQTEPIQRMVALKIIKPGMDTRQVIARFEAERQALAMMDHPHIAKVFDAGTTESGRPYFVMELVKGVPITKFCDDHKLTVRQRLELFKPVCQAVQHAHQKGVIHRDLKPSNILVAEYDGQPVPKIIDFGVAKATAQKLTERTMFTEVGQVIGTVEYMSPEQAKFNQLDIDTRTDIYSLGVLLYELLTGSTPFERQRLREAAFDEVLRIIREEEPPKLSTKLSSSDALPSIAANRHTEPARLSKEVRGELDWIVMKCLEKDRNRRYEMASGLARDVERYLHDEPVQAGPPSTVYRLKRLVRRHKAATISLMVLIAAASALGVNYFRKLRNERIDAIYRLAQVSAEAQRHKDAEHYYKTFLSLVAGDRRVDDARRGLAVSFLRQGKTADGVEILKDLLHEKILRMTTPEASVLREAWSNLPVGDVKNNAPADQSGLSFDGDQDYVALPTLVFDGNPPWTLEVIANPFEFKFRGGDEWISLVSATEVGSIGLDILKHNWSLELYTADFFGRSAVQWQQNYATARANNEVKLNEWQHIAGVWDGKELRIYVDGQLQESRPRIAYCSRLSEASFFLGADPSPAWRNEIAEACFCGQIRAARISRRVEYTESFASPARLANTPDTVGLYDFTKDTGRYAIDRSGHGNHGIIVGAKFVKSTISN